MPYRDSVPAGTLVLSSGLGGVYPKGIPVGTVIGVAREQAGWERVYRLRPAANPGSAAHVLILVTPSEADFAPAVPERLHAPRGAPRFHRTDPPGGLPGRGRAHRRRGARRVAGGRAKGHDPPSRTAAGRSPGRHLGRARRPAPDPAGPDGHSGSNRTGAMSPGRANRLQLALVLALLVLLHFYVRPRLWSSRLSPDFLLIALMLFSMRSSPGVAAVAGFIVGLVADSLTPARFGAAALAHTIVGYLASWGRSLFFADNLLVNAGFVAAGLWLRDLGAPPGERYGAGPASGGADGLQSTAGPHDGAVRHPGARRLSGVVRHQARRMNGFDSYRVRERAEVARLVLIAVFLVLVGAFFRTQVIQHEKFQLRAETNRLRPIPLTPPRGTIYDRKGDVIAENVPGYSVKVLAPSVDSLRAVLLRVARFVAARHGADDRGHPALRRGPVPARGHLRRRHLRDDRHGWRSTARCCPGS